MKLLKLLFITIIFLSGCMAPPKQPALTVKEKEYLNTLRQMCHCKVYRQVNPDQKIRNITPEVTSWYNLSFDSLSYSSLQNKDSLRIYSMIVAKMLHNKILGKSFQFPYKTMTIAFRYLKTPDSWYNLSFSYDTLELR